MADTLDSTGKYVPKDLDIPLLGTLTDSINAIYFINEQ